VRKYDVKVNGQARRDLAEEEITDLYSRGSVTRDTPCKVVGTDEWWDVNEFFPTLKYHAVGAPIRVRELPQQPVRRADVDFERDERMRPAMTSALKAGWICFGLGVAIAWIFPPAFLFYSVALIMAIVAMCTHQVNKGLALLLTSFVGMGTSAFVSMMLAIGLFAHAVAPAVAKVEKDAEEMRRAQRQFIAAQENALASIGQSLTTSRPAIRTQRPQSASIQDFNQRQLLDEVARLEKQQRDLRRSGRDLSGSSQNYLEQLRSALDKGG
jgi:hypothetical protein